MPENTAKNATKTTYWKPNEY